MLCYVTASTNGPLLNLSTLFHMAQVYCGESSYKGVLHKIEQGQKISKPITFFAYMEGLSSVHLDWIMMPKLQVAKVTFISHQN